MMLSTKQAIFCKNASKFILKLNEYGYDVTDGEAYRTKEQAEWYAKKGIGSKNSLHCIRLARDLNLFLDGVYLEKTEDYKFAGDIWKSIHELNRWGGDFKDKEGNPKPDANHFSMEHEGKK